MKLFVYAGCFVVLTVALLAATTALARNLEHQPPVVIRTVPESGAKNVDPALSEIRVTFSKEMMDRAGPGFRLRRRTSLSLSESHGIWKIKEPVW